MPRSIEVLVSEPFLEVDHESVTECLACLDELYTYSVPVGSIEVAFVDEKTCCQLHLDFFDDADPTDVMTFPGDPSDGHAGDIAICPAVAARRCRTEGTSFTKELTLYLAHAWLHLAGFEDKDEKTVGEMRAAENQLMAHLENASRLLRATWCG